MRLLKLRFILFCLFVYWIELFWALVVYMDLIHCFWFCVWFVYCTWLLHVFFFLWSKCWYNLEFVKMDEVSEFILVLNCLENLWLLCLRSILDLLLHHWVNFHWNLFSKKIELLDRIAWLLVEFQLLS